MATGELGLIDVASFENSFCKTVLGHAEHGATEMFGGGDVVWEKQF